MSQDLRNNANAQGGVGEQPGGATQVAEVEAKLRHAYDSRDWAQVSKLAMQLLSLENAREESLGSGKKLVFNQLTVFQGDPLVFRDHEGNLYPTPPLGFISEKDALEFALQGTIKLSFDICTTDRLNDFLASSQSQFLHLSCHGVKGGVLAMEDYSGNTHFVDSRTVESLFRASLSHLKVVFISACFSRDIGESLVAAGVPHVICCKKCDDIVRDDACIEFTKAFYRKLKTNQGTLREAFEHAKTQVQSSPNVAESRLEADKFVLLPEGDQYHNELVDVPTAPIASPILHDRNPIIGCIPQPPLSLIGRQLDVYSVIDTLFRKDDIVCLHGPKGRGKRTMASFIANYVNERRIPMHLDDVIWWPATSKANYCYQEFRTEIEPRLKEGRTFLIIDATGKEMENTDKLAGLAQFLERLLDSVTTTIKLLILCEKADSMEINTCRGKRFIALEPLSFESSAELFGKFCHHVSYKSEHSHLVNSVGDFVNLIFRNHSYRGARKVTELKSKRSKELFETIGEGHPGSIEKNATSLTLDKYEELINTASKNELVFNFATRYELDTCIIKSEVQRYDAIEKGQFQKAQELDDLWSELVKQRENLKSKEQLLHEKENIQSQIDKEKDKENAARKMSDSESSLTQLNLPALDSLTVSGNSTATRQPIARMKRMEDVVTNGTPDAVHEHLVADFIVPNSHYEEDKSHPFKLQIHGGAVQTFSRPNLLRSAIVVASNEACTGGVGVLRAVTELGGESLQSALEAKPSVAHSDFGTIRCMVGGAIIVGPGESGEEFDESEEYGQLKTPYVIFAVAPWSEAENEEHNLLFLRSAYFSALKKAKEAKLEAVAFSLLGANTRGGVDWKKAVRTGFDTIARYPGYQELKEVHVYAFASREVEELVMASKKYDFLEKAADATS